MRPMEAAACSADHRADSDVLVVERRLQDDNKKSQMMKKCSPTAARGGGGLVVVGRESRLAALLILLVVTVFEDRATIGGCLGRELSATSRRSAGIATKTTAMESK